MPEPDGLSSGTEALDGRTADELVSLAGAPTEHELTGPDRGLEHQALYAVILLTLIGGSMLLQQGQSLARGMPAAVTVHTVMESIATILAFIVAGLALVRYYSRKQTTFLLIGCGF